MHFSEFDEPEMLDEDGLPVTEAALEGTEPRKRRRRRRGGRGRKRGERGEQTRSAERSAAPEERSSEEEDPPEFDGFDDSELRDRKSDDADADFEHESELNGGHRAVPSWQEAVGYLVSANLESRAKSPDARGQHRGKGRGRGGRHRHDSH